MRILLWISSIALLVAIYYSNEISSHVEASFGIKINTSLLQVVLSVVAGMLATKASDSSTELNRLLKLNDIQKLVGQADEAEKKYENLSNLIKKETEQQFARDMLTSHRNQLQYHWNEINRLEILLETGVDDNERTVREHIQNYIIKTKYADYLGRNFLGKIPVFGDLLSYLFSPLWDAYYQKNIKSINRLFKIKAVKHDETNKNGLKT